MDTIEIFRKKLKERTDAKNPRQTELAAKTGMYKSELNDFLQGRRNISINKCEQIAKSLGTTFVEIVSTPYTTPTDNPPSVSEPDQNNLIKLPHAEIIEKFTNKPRARDANLALLSIERIAPDVFEKIVSHIQSVEWGLKMVNKNNLSGNDRKDKKAG